MRLIVTTVISLALLLAAGCSRGKEDGTASKPSGTTLSSASTDGIRWHTYLDMAEREAARDHRRVLAAFYSHDCPVCKAMDDSVYNNPEVRDLLADVVAVRISVEADSATTDSLRVREHPTAVFLNADGTEIDRIVGYSSAASFLASAKNILGGRGTLENMLAQESAHASDTPYKFDIAQKLYHRREYDEALTRLRAVVAADPKNHLGATDKALFLTGRILNEQKRFEESIVPLGQLIEEFPTSTLVPEAHLFRAIGLLSLRGRNQQGVDELKLVVRDYPKSRAASWAREQLTILSQPKPPAATPSPPGRS